MSDYNPIDALIHRTVVLRLRPPVQRQGDTGDWVPLLRDCLIAHGALPPTIADLDPRLRGVTTLCYTADVTAAVTRFQEAHSLDVDGLTGPQTWAALGVTPDGWGDLGQVTLFYARWQAYRGARERGGNNRGPDVEEYLNGTGLVGVPWCAALATWCYRRACAALGLEPDVTERLSSSRLAIEGAPYTSLVHHSGRNLLALEIRNKPWKIPASLDPPPPGSFVLVRGGENGIKHTALLQEVRDGRAYVIEGNVRPRKWIPGQYDAVRPGSYKLNDVVFVVV